MGEAKRRLEASMEGKPYRPPLVCPECKSIRVRVRRLDAKLMSHVPTEYALCGACNAVWEAYPKDWCEDVVGAVPCDNCAFTAGSPEQADSEAWADLVAKLRAGAEFQCHKGAPIVKDDEGGLRFKMEAIRPRWCAGFARMVWALEAKGGDYSWLAARYPSLFDQERQP